jgi:CDP-glycerol glycerophosphotransferase
MNSPIISVIVPVYMVEPYLRQCLDSLVAQTMSDLEIILVDDGSPDGCPAICDEYAGRDLRIRVIHKENGGLSDARNAGIDVARGNYIGFVDSDDWIAPDMFEYLYQGAKDYEADVVVCEYYNVWGKKADATTRTSVRSFSGEASMRALLQLRIGNYAWNKLYRRSLWADDIRYPVGKNYEDVRTTYRVFDRASRVVALPEVKYFYRRHDQSITGVKSVKNEGECLESRMARFEALEGRIDEWPEVREFMLKEILNYTRNFRKVVCDSAEEEFRQNAELVGYICSFLRSHSQMFFDLYQWGRAGRKAFSDLFTPEYNKWKQSSKISSFINKRAEFNQSKTKRKERNGGGSNLEVAEPVEWYYNEGMKLPLIDDAALVESRGGEDLAGNMYAIAEGLCARGIKVYLVAKDNCVEKVRGIAASGSFPGVTYVEKYSSEYYRAFATCKYLFNDMTYPETILKKDGQVFVNTWHGTPLKALEQDVHEQRSKSGGATRGYMQCDYIAVPSKYLADKILESACIDQIYPGKILYSGYPRNSVFFDVERRSRVRKALGDDDKEVYVYMPTWRGSFDGHVDVGDEYSSQSVADFFERTLSDNQVMYVKLHNFAVSQVCFDGYRHVRPFPTEFDSYEVLNTADCLITDYSSVFFDYANCGGKVILFAHDRAEYERERGLYLDLDDLPFPIAYNYEQLAAQLNVDKTYDDADFRATYCTYDCPDSTEKLLATVIDGKQACHAEGIVSNGKRNVLLYDAQFYLRYGMPEEVEKLLGSLDAGEANYYYGYRQWVLDDTPKYLQNLPEGIRLYAFAKDAALTRKELRREKKGARGNVSAEVVDREMNRIFYGNPFDEIRIIGANEYDPFCGFLRSLPNYCE